MKSKNSLIIVWSLCLTLISTVAVAEQTDTKPGSGGEDAEHGLKVPAPYTTGGNNMAASTCKTLSVSNTATGSRALCNNTTGLDNTAMGYFAMYLNTAGNRNAAIGNNTLHDNTTGGYNTAMGGNALFHNTTGNENTATGAGALYSNTTGIRNVAVGWHALKNNIGPDSSSPNGEKSGYSNTAVGWQALTSNKFGLQNTAIGESALNNNQNGNHNTAIGEDALFNTNASNNTAIGESAMYDNSSGTDNVALGRYTLNHSTTGTRNIALGAQSGCGLTMGNNNNIYIGSLGSNLDNDVIRIGSDGNLSASKCPDDNLKLPPHHSTFIAGIAGTPVTGSPVYVTKSGQLGVSTSSERFKKDIQSAGGSVGSVLDLRPVSFRYKTPDESGTYPVQYGLIAEEVAKVMPEMVQYDRDGKPFSVNYQFLAPLLLAVAQHQHAELQRQQELLASLQREIETLKAGQVAGGGPK